MMNTTQASSTLVSLASFIRRAEFGRDEHVYTQGERHKNLFYQIVAGYILLEFVSPDGCNLFSGLKGPGDRIGIADALRNADRAETAAVRSFKAKLDVYEVPSLAPLLAETIDELVETNLYLIERDRLTGTERVGLYLYRLSATPDTTIPLAHHEIAALIGTTRETVTRALGAFSETGILGSAAYKHIRVADRGKLEAWLIQHGAISERASPNRA